ELARRMEALEDAEQFVGVTRIEPDAIVADKESRLAFGVLATDFDFRLRSLLGVFQRVAEQVDQNLAEGDWIAMDAWKRRDGPLDFARSDFGFQFGDR